MPVPSLPTFARFVLIPLVVCCVTVLAADEKKAAPEAPWQPLFDGKTLAGWRPIGVGSWTVEDEAIVGRHEKKDPYGHLVTERSFKDFTVRLKFKCLKGNSGLYFRVAVSEKAFSGLSGFQAEIDPRADVGGLYETNGRGWVVKPKPADVKTWLKPDDWNEMTVTARGGDITVTVNGTTTAEVKDDKGKWTEGPFALQVHGGQDGLVYFKDIEVREDAGAGK